MNFGTKKIALAIFCASILSAGCIPRPSPLSPLAASPYNRTLAVGNKNLKVEIVSTPEKMALGLSGRKKMGSDEGMLFVFSPPAAAGFWMKDMKFNLDFLWIANGKIVAITKNISAPASPTSDKDLAVYRPPAVVDEVLEVNAGWADKNRVAVGDAVELK